MPYTSPGEALGEGLKSGLGLAMTFQQVKQQRDQQQWENQLKTADLGMKLVENKNLPADQRIAAYNKGVRPVLQRMQIDMPEMTPDILNSDAFQNTMKANNGLVKDYRAKKIDSHTLLNGVTGNFTNFLTTNKEETDTQEKASNLLMKEVNTYVDEEDKAKAAKEGKELAPDEIVKRLTDLQITKAKLGQTGDLNSQVMYAAIKKAGLDVQPGKISPDDLRDANTMINKQISLLNAALPEKYDAYRFKQKISPEEYAVMKHTPGANMDQLRRDFAIHAPQPAPLAPAAVPAAAPAPARPVVAPTRSALPMAAPAVAMAPAPVAPVLSLGSGAVAPTPVAPLQLSPAATPYDEKAGQLSLG